MSLCCGRRKVAHKSAFVKSSALRWIRGDRRFGDSLPHPDYIQRIIQHFRVSSSPESMRRVDFSPDKILCEYVSASCHLPGAYVKFFPCRHCSYTDEENDEYVEFFVEAFHIANFHEPNVCATVTFTMPAVFSYGLLTALTDCSVEVEFTTGCPNAPLAADHSPRVALHIHTDGFIEVLRFLTRSELDDMRLVSRRWSNVIGLAEGTLQQQRSFFATIKFFGESSGMLSVHFIRRELSGDHRCCRTPCRPFVAGIAEAAPDRFKRNAAAGRSTNTADRRKQFRYRLLGKDTMVRVHVYANRKARECLTVLTFDHFRRTVRFFKGNVSLPDLKLTLQHRYAYY